jgi:RNA polymerase sigma factor (sigma-70 family)
MTQEELILEGLKQVKYIAAKYARKSHLDVDDLIQEGVIGILQAAKRFDSSKGASFHTFVQHRILGAILDYARKEDPLDRNYRIRIKNGVDQPITYICLDDPNCTLNLTTQEKKPDLRINWIKTQIKSFKPKYRMVFELYYFENQTMDEIAKQFNLCPARISQIIKLCNRKLAKRFNKTASGF